MTKDNESRREQILDEIIVSEERYYTSLLRLTSEFVQDEEFQEIIRRNRHEPEDLFNNIQLIADFHKEFVKALKDETKNIPEVFLKNCMFLLIYTTFVNNYDRVIKTFDDLQASDKFCEYLFEKQKAGVDLMAHLIMPVQRVPRYEMLLKELKKHTPKGHPEYDDLNISLSKVTDIATRINESKRKFERVDKILEIKSDINLIQPGRDLLHDDDLKLLQDPVTSSRKGPRDERRFYLFSDLLLFVNEDNKLEGAVDLFDAIIDTDPPVYTPRARQSEENLTDPSNSLSTSPEKNSGSPFDSRLQTPPNLTFSPIEMANETASIGMSDENSSSLSENAVPPSEQQIDEPTADVASVDTAPVDTSSGDTPSVDTPPVDTSSEKSSRSLEQGGQEQEAQGQGVQEHGAQEQGGQEKGGNEKESEEEPPEVNTTKEAPPQETKKSKAKKEEPPEADDDSDDFMSMMEAIELGFSGLSDEEPPPDDDTPVPENVGTLVKQNSEEMPPLVEDSNASTTPQVVVTPADMSLKLGGLGYAMSKTVSTKGPEQNDDSFPFSLEASLSPIENAREDDFEPSPKTSPTVQKRKSFLTVDKLKRNQKGLSFESFLFDGDESETSLEKDVAAAVQAKEKEEEGVPEPQYKFHIRGPNALQRSEDDPMEIWWELSTQTERTFNIWTDLIIGQIKKLTNSRNERQIITNAKSPMDSLPHTPRTPQTPPPQQEEENISHQIIQRSSTSPSPTENQPKKSDERVSKSVPTTPDKTERKRVKPPKPQKPPPDLREYKFYPGETLGIEFVDGGEIIHVNASDSAYKLGVRCGWILKSVNNIIAESDCLRLVHQVRKAFHCGPVLIGFSPGKPSEQFREKYPDFEPHKASEESQSIQKVSLIGKRVKFKMRSNKYDVSHTFIAEVIKQEKKPFPHFVTYIDSDETDEWLRIDIDTMTVYDSFGHSGDFSFVQPPIIEENETESHAELVGRLRTQIGSFQTALKKLEEDKSEWEKERKGLLNQIAKLKGEEPEEVVEKPERVLPDRSYSVITRPERFGSLCEPTGQLRTRSRYDDMSQTFRETSPEYEAKMESFPEISPPPVFRELTDPRKFDETSGSDQIAPSPPVNKQSNLPFNRIRDLFEGGEAYERKAPPPNRPTQTVSAPPAPIRKMSKKKIGRTNMIMPLMAPQPKGKKGKEKPPKPARKLKAKSKPFYERMFGSRPKTPEVKPPPPKKQLIVPNKSEILAAHRSRSSSPSGRISESKGKSKQQHGKSTPDVKIKSKNSDQDQSRRNKVTPPMTVITGTAEDISICQNCGAHGQVRPFCNKCGKQTFYTQRRSVQKEKECINCESPNQGRSFCSNCGKPTKFQKSKISPQILPPRASTEDTTSTAGDTSSSAVDTSSTVRPSSKTSKSISVKGASLPTGKPREELGNSKKGPLSRRRRSSGSMKMRTPQCVRCSKPAYFQESIMACGGKWHKRCFKCDDCMVRLALGAQKEIKMRPFCNQCFYKRTSLTGKQKLTSTPVPGRDIFS